MVIFTEKIAAYAVVPGCELCSDTVFTGPPWIWIVDAVVFLPETVPLEGSREEGGNTKGTDQA
jgi:hypothetical protein